MNRPLWTYKELDRTILLKLRSHGFHSKTDVEKNIDRAQKICENIKNIIFNDETKTTWLSGLEILKRENEKQYVTTLSKDLDQLLCGGIELGKLTEIYGNCGSGKTQLCLQLAMNATLPRELGGLEAESVYIETSKSVFPSRLSEMIGAYVDHVKVNLELKERNKLNANLNNSIATGQDRVTLPKRISDSPELTSSTSRVETNRRSPDLSNHVGDTCTVPRYMNHLVENVDIKEELSNIAESADKAGTSLNNVIRKRKREEINEQREFDKPDEKTKNKSEMTDADLDKALGLRSKNDAREFKISIKKTDLDNLINESKKSKTSLNTLLRDKLDTNTGPKKITKALVRSKIHVHYCSNYYEIIALVMNIESALKHSKHLIKLIILDNITFLFHNEEDSNYLKRTKNVYFLLNMLSKLAVTYKLAVVIVNQLTTKYTNRTASAKVVPALGETFAHRINTRLLLQKFSLGPLSSAADSTDNVFMCLVDKMILHNRHLGDKKHVLFQINAHGIRDV